jgi:type IV pilus assembly protein PilQ
MLFSFKEDTIDSETTSPDQTAETRNEINTRILAAPGDVAVLAGLYRQTTSDQVDGIPGLTGNSVAAGLLGGASSTSKVRSELLVFIAPTVLEPGA